MHIVGVVHVCMQVCICVCILRVCPGTYLYIHLSFNLATNQSRCNSIVFFWGGRHRNAWWAPPSMSVCLYVCMYVYMCIYTYIYTHVYVCICIRMYMCVVVSMRVFICIFVRICIHVCECVYSTYVYAYACMHMHT